MTLTLTCLTIFLLALPLPSYYFTHIHLGVLDLVFHKRKETLVEWLPLPYSDHSFLLIDLWQYFWNGSIERVVNIRAGKE